MNNDFDIEMNMNGISNEVNTQKYSNFSVAVISKAVGDTAQGAGDVAMAIARSKEAKARIAEIGGARKVQLKDCEKSKENIFVFDQKKTKNRIRDCKALVTKRFDLEEAEQRDIVKRMTAIEEGKISSEQRRADIDLTAKTGEIDEKKSSKKLYVFGGIFALVLVLGTIVYIKSKSK